MLDFISLRIRCLMFCMAAMTTVLPFAATAQDLGGLLDLGGKKVEKKAIPKAEVSLQKTKEKEVVLLTVKIPVPAGSHTYSMWEGFSGRTSISINEKSLAGLKLLDDTFQSDRKPAEKQDKILKQRVEYFDSDVTFTRRFQLLPGASAESVKLAGTVRYQLCDDNSCRPESTPFEVTLGNASAGLKFEYEWQMTTRAGGVEKPGPSRWTVKLSPADAKPGDRVTLDVTMNVAPNYHIFALDQNPKNLGLPTVITVDLNGLKDAAKVDVFKPSSEPLEHETEGKLQRYHHGQVTLSKTFVVTAPQYGVSGKVSFQICLEGPTGNCRPGRFEFSVGHTASKTADAVITPLSDSGPKTALFDDLKLREIGREGVSGQSFGMFLLYAFLGGLILNIMPCVLPVIAIKALSFAQQAGEHRSQILVLNIAYSLGVQFVFLVLASLAAFASLSWGGQFQNDTFNLVMCSMVFAMGLSLLGVFEIPVPGFVGSVAGGGHREGPSGAFLTGIFATVMATPCSGPFLGSTLAWAIKQPTPVIYAVWSMMGLGLAFPYLVFAVVPGAVKLLPKPGNWMIYFKQIAGFAMLGTTIYLLSIIPQAMLISALIVLLGVGAAVWMVGNLCNYSSTSKRRWIVRCSAAGVLGFMVWLGLAPGIKLAWQPFGPSQLEAALSQNKPVIIDFTADWCATCKTVEKLTLNTRTTKEFVEKHEFVMLKADWTDYSEEIREVLNRLGADAIPTLAIFSPARPKEPIVLQELWTRATLLEQLEKVVAENSGPAIENTNEAATTAVPRNARTVTQIKHQ